MAARKMSKLRLRAMILLAAVLLLVLPSAAVAKAMAIDASKTQRLDLPDGLVGPESVAFDRRNCDVAVMATHSTVKLQLRT